MYTAGLQGFEASTKPASHPAAEPPPAARPAPPARAALEEFVQHLRHSRDTLLAEVVTCRGTPLRRSQLRQWLSQQGHRPVLLRPPEPWDDLAPLRQLLQHHGRRLPEPSQDELCLESLWLGADTARARLFLRAALELSHSPTLAVGRLSDLGSAGFGGLLSFAMHGRLRMPVTFLLEAEPAERIPHGLRRLDLDALDPASAALLDAAPAEDAALPAPGRLALAYLAQARFFGDTLQPDQLRSVTRADQERRMADFVQAGLLDQDLRLQADRLAGLALPALPQGRRWAQRSLRVLHRTGQGDSPRALWLQARLRPEDRTASAAPLAAASACRAAVELGEAPAHALLRALPLAALDPQAQAVRTLLAIELGARDGVQPELLALGLPYGALLAGRLAMRLGEKNAGDQLAALRDRLESAGHKPASALLSLELARWHLAHFRIRPALVQLGKAGEQPHWVLRWLRELNLAEAYLHMGRLDFARTHAQRVLAAPPRPMSPVLKGDLYLTLGKIFQADRLESQADNALERAREVYAGARDATRLGRYLLTRGEIHWRGGNNDEARQMFSRAIRILLELKAGLLAREAELKLSLVLHGIRPEALSG